LQEGERPETLISGRSVFECPVVAAHLKLCRRHGFLMRTGCSQFLDFLIKVRRDQPELSEATLATRRLVHLAEFGPGKEKVLPESTADA